MFRLLRVIIRPSNELTQYYLNPSALTDPSALTMGGVIVVLSTCPPYNYSVQLPMVSMLLVYKTTRYLVVVIVVVNLVIYSWKLRRG